MRSLLFRSHGPRPLTDAVPVRCAGFAASGSSPSEFSHEEVSCSAVAVWALNSICVVSVGDTARIAPGASHRSFRRLGFTESLRSGGLGASALGS